MNSKAQIVATIGPSSFAPEIFLQLLNHQVDVVRVNCSWEKMEEFPAHVEMVRRVAKTAGRHIPIMQDLPGPRVQEGTVHGYDHELASSFTEHDEEWMKLGAELGVEYAALSFVGSAKDIADAQAARERHHGKQKLIAKIERAQAITALDSIIEASDGVMVARGDLGSELPLEEIPFAQAHIIHKTNAAGKPVIVATQMMLSMTEHQEPTRAEVTDVAAAILQGADAVMLSEESATGKYPVEAVAMMERIVEAAEKHVSQKGHTPREYHLL